jgi:glycosyltransferase involved in cell wall biosynthesis
MRILLFNWRDTKHPKAGGAEIVTLEHAKGWAKAGHTVTWFTAHFFGAPKDEIIDGVRIVRRAGSLTVYLAAPVYYVLHRREFDVVVDEVHGIPFFTPLYVRKPIIAFVHEVAGEIWDYMVGFPFNHIGKFLERVYLKMYKNITFWTDARSTVDNLVALGVPKTRCIAIPCPITNNIAVRSPVKEKHFTCIFVSRVVQMKGVEEVIKAFSFIALVDSKAQLWIVGGGEPLYMARLKEMIEDYGIESQVTFVGKVSEEQKLNLMGRAHVLLHASVKEGWGLVVLEAASQWTPSVVYNIAGLVDVVKHGQTGLVVHKNSPHEMAKAAMELAKNKTQYQKLQKGAVLWVKSLSWKHVVEESLALLHRTVKN